MIRPVFLWLSVLFVCVGCGPADRQRTVHTVGLSAVDQVSLDPPTGDLDPSDNREIIELPISVFIYDDTQLAFSSSRTAEEVVQLHNRANEIWSQAGIRFTFKKVHRATVPLAMSANIIRWEVDAFFAAQADLNRNMQPSTPISGYYVKTVRGPNGIASEQHLAFFVADDPVNDDARVVAHELGHLLGLIHVNDPERLMHSGTDGLMLTAEEIMIARKTAENLK